MGNQIRAELYRLRQRRWTWWGFPAVLSACAALLVLGSAASVVCTSEGHSGPAYALCLGLRQLLFLGTFFASSCSTAAFSDQHKLGTLKNEAVFGISRTRIYLARLAAAVLMGLMAALACFASALVLALLVLPDPGATLAAFGQLIPWVAGALPLWTGCCALCLCLEFCLRSDGLAITLYLLYLIPGWLMTGTFAVVGEGFLSSGSGGPLSYLALLLYAVHPLAPFSPAALQIGGVSPRALYLDGGWGSAGVCWLIGLGWVAATTVVGIAVFRRRELR